MDLLIMWANSEKPAYKLDIISYDQTYAFKSKGF